MLTQDFFTSHKLSQELFALGVKSISGYWYDKDDKKSLYDSADVEDLNNACEGIEWIPAYLDSELLKRLPFEIKENGEFFQLHIEKGDKYCVSYDIERNGYSGYESLNYFTEKTLAEALGKMVKYVNSL